MDQEESSIDIGAYISILLRWWWAVAVFAVAAGGLAYLQTTQQTPLYRSSADILVQQARSGLIGPTNTTANQELAAAYARLAISTELVDQVVDELNLSNRPNVSAAGRKEVLRITAQDPDPVLARDVANTLAELLMLDIQINKLSEIARLEALAESQGISVGQEILRAQISSIDSLRLIEPALAAESPFAPNLARRTAIGLFLGILFGMVAAFLLERFTHKLRNVKQLEKILAVPEGTLSTLGVIYKWRAKDVGQSGLVTRDEPNGVYAEMFRNLRSALHFARSENGLSDSKGILVTSAVPGEGKTTVAANLAIVLAQSGLEVILVDGDLRKPELDELFGLDIPHHLDHTQGFGPLLMQSNQSAKQHLSETGIQGLSLLVSGNVGTNPADLLSTPIAEQLFQSLKRECDILIVDSPPIAATVDSLIMARYLEGIVIPIDLGHVRYDVLEESLRQARRTRTPILGFVLNKLTPGRMGRGRYYERFYKQYSVGYPVDLDGYQVDLDGKESTSKHSAGTKGLSD